MAEDLTLFQTCEAQFPGSSNISSLLECVTDAQVERSTSIAGGLDAFFLIFAGAMVL